MNQKPIGGLNVLLGSHIFFPKHRAGTEVLTLELAKGLRTRGHRVRVLTCEREEAVPENSNPWMTEDVYDGVPVHRIHYGVAKLRDPITNHLNAPKRITLVKDLVSRWKPDAVHFSHLFGFSAQVIPEIRSMGVPVIFTPTDYWVLCPRSILYRTFDRKICDGPGKGAVDCLYCLYPLPKWAGKLAWKVAESNLHGKIGPFSSLHSLTLRTKVIVECVNAASKILPATKFLADLLARHGVVANRMKVIPYGVDVGDLPEKIPVPQTFTEENPLQLGFIGQLSEIKGLHIVLEALSRLRNQQGLVTLNIYGNPDKDNRYLQRLLAIAGKTGNNVLFKGTFPHEKIGEILRALHFLVVPSVWYESTPLVLCSALSAGIPVLVSRLGGMMEIVEDGVNGFSYPAEDAKELSEIIASLLENPGVIREISSSMNIRNRSVSDYVREVEFEYLSLIDKGSASTDAVS